MTESRAVQWHVTAKVTPVGHGNVLVWSMPAQRVMTVNKRYVRQNPTVYTRWAEPPPQEKP